MKRIIVMIGLLISVNTKAQIPVLEIIRQGVKKVIIAVDLKIQRMQSKVVILQNAQKTVENAMSKVKLTEISEWVEKQRKLYDDYFQELKMVKEGIVFYHRVKEVISNQAAMVNEYKQAWALFRQDKNFTSDELKYMFSVYTGMMDESLKNLDQLFLVVTAFTTQMSDAKRMELLSLASENIEGGYMDLRKFNNQNKVISLQRASDRAEIEYLKRMYGL
ncbi:MAG: conjugal transfer protein TraI [Bacteroidetes bacterium]|nr:MAG: conjugal transfer protein TraI [Bacteroidota bacterium]